MSDNLSAATAVYGLSEMIRPANTSATLILNNPAGSGKVFRILTMRLINTKGQPKPSCVINAYPEDDMGGTPVRLYNSTIGPNNNDDKVYYLIRDAFYYLAEDRSLGITASEGNAINVFISYEEIS